MIFKVDGRILALQLDKCSIPKWKTIHQRNYLHHAQTIELINLFVPMATENETR
jgi:hypothetical protein